MTLVEKGLQNVSIDLSARVPRGMWTLGLITTVLMR